MKTHGRGTAAAVSLVLAALIGLFSCNTQSYASGRAQDEQEQRIAAANDPAPAQSAPAAAPQGGRELAPMPSLAPLVESVKAAVVNVDVQAAVRGAALGTDTDPLERFFGVPGRRPQPRQGTGSGFIIDPQGRVLTNNHVVEDAVAIRVRLDDGRMFDARVLGRDPLTDLALLQLEKVQGKLPWVRLGDSDAMRVGDYVVAIGNPFGLASSVSAGILSARARDIHSGPYDDFLQTDAAINPGNSGGPLFNLRGEVIGINTAIIGGGTGIGFAVPSNMARDLLPQLEKGEVRRGWLGVQIQDLKPDIAEALKAPVKSGAVVMDVNKGTPADKAGIQIDDVIAAIDGKPVSTSKDLTRLIGSHAPGTTSELTVYRGGQKRDVKVTLGERPDLEGVRGRGAAPQRSEERSEKLGLTVRDAEPQMGRGGGGQGALIVDVTPGSRADDANLAAGMVIIEAAGEPVRNARDFQRIVSKAPSGKSLLLRIQAGEARFLRALPIP
ncbi:MAG TPA: Do family serine endopeptidase [Myxococcaceae bacterium]|nr:Do family serine endopeptidase [Myxococcaceae bacterium]